MKKGFLLIPAMLFVLAACNNVNPSESQGSASTQGTPSVSQGSTSTPEPEVVEVTKKFSLNLNPADGTKITLETSADAEGKFEAGSTIKFSVEVEDESVALLGATVNGKAVAPSEDGYEFVMPNANATIATQTMSLGSADIAKVSDVDEELLPETVTDVYEILLASVEKESVLLARATYDSTYETSISNTYHFDGEVGVNGVAKINQRYYSSSSSYSVYTGEEYGLVGEDRLYSFTESSSTGSTVNFTSSGTIRTIVDDETEQLKGNEIAEKEATTKVSTVGFINKLLDRTFGNKTESFLNTKDNDGWNFFEVTNSVDESNKFFTTEVTARYKSTYYRNTVKLTLVIDGDGFVNSAKFVQNSYKSSDWDNDNFKPFDGAEVDSTRFIDVAQTRGYRRVLDKKDVAQYVVHDYDVLTSYAFDEISTSTTYEAIDNKVGNSGVLSFKFRQSDNHPIIMIPTLVGSEENGFIEFNEAGKPVVSKVGTFHALFDNGLGEIKSVEMEAVVPNPVKIQATLMSDGVVYHEDDSILVVQILPLAAAQDAEVVLDDNSTAEVEITNNNDGTFTIRGTTYGEGKLIVSSAVDKTLTTTVNFKVEDKPTYESLTNFLTSKTLHGFLSGWGNHFINFNEGGRGEYVCYEGDAGAVIGFSWSLDEDTLVLTFEFDAEPVKSKYYTPESFDKLTTSSIQFDFSYNGSKKGPITLTALEEKLDFSTANFKDYSK
ncbi:MAG: hypothetical protein J1F32_02205 [Erysipelotrichales bacterium]|nr:hypothetical protein [Erysipelotrichales bacterium]